MNLKKNFARKFSNESQEEFLKSFMEMIITGCIWIEKDLWFNPFSIMLQSFLDYVSLVCVGDY